MQITPIKNSQNFYGVNTSKLCAVDLNYIKKELPLIEEIGKKYDIKLKSSYEGIYDYESIDVIVSPLKDALNFWTKLFGPKGKSTFYLHKNNKSFVEKVNDAVKDLNSKNKLGKLIDTFEK